MDPNVRAAIGADGFDGYTALFSTVVSRRNFWVNYDKGQPDEARFTRLLLDRGADPNVTASIRHASSFDKRRTELRCRHRFRSQAEVKITEQGPKSDTV